MDYKIAKEWLDTLHKTGGAVYDIDFTDYYNQYHCFKYDKNFKCDKKFYEAIDLFRTSVELVKVKEYLNLGYDLNNRTERYSPAHYGNIERPVHMIWMLQQKNPIVYKPTLIYNEKLKLRLINGSARILALSLKTKKVPVLYFHYGDTPLYKFSQQTQLKTVDEIFKYCKLDESEYDDQYSVVIGNTLGSESFENIGYLNYACSGKLNLQSKIAWQAQALEYFDLIKNFSSTLDAVKSLSSGSIENNFSTFN